MLNKVFKLASSFADYTVGTAMVLTHLAMVDRRHARETMLRNASPSLPQLPRRPARPEPTRH